MQKKKVLLVFGTRPEAIKMAPLALAFQNAEDFDTKICVTAQHREMLDQVMSFFNLKADYDLNIMKPNQNLYGITSEILTQMKVVFDDFKPDYVFVHGDTTTAMTTSLAAFYAQAKVCHIEAGLRTNNKWSPYPEEMNRQVIGRIADYHFAPTDSSKENLLKENISADTILVTGNTVIDALLKSVGIVKDSPTSTSKKLEEKLGKDQKVILVTGHRRENHGQGFINICSALKTIATNRPDVTIVYPVHLNPNVLKPVNEILGDVENILLIEPLGYPDFIWLMNRSYIIITDSGGVQEEAPSLGKPVLVMRETTERPEAVDVGTVILVGTDADLIVSETNRLLNDVESYNQMSTLHNPYGDGQASDRIVNFIRKLD